MRHHSAGSRDDTLLECLRRNYYYYYRGFYLTYVPTLALVLLFLNFYMRTKFKSNNSRLVSVS